MTEEEDQEQHDTERLIGNERKAYWMEVVRERERVVNIAIRKKTIFDC